MHLPGYVTLHWPTWNFICCPEVQLLCPAVPSRFLGPSLSLITKKLTVGIHSVSTLHKIAAPVGRGTLGGEIHHAGTSGGKPGGCQTRTVCSDSRRRVRARGEIHTSPPLALQCTKHHTSSRAFPCSRSGPSVLPDFCFGHGGTG